MLGPLVNAAVVLICSLAGCFLIRSIPGRFEEILRKAIGLSIVYVGIRGTLDNERVLLLIMSMVAGSVIGEFLNIDGLMNRFGFWAEKKLGLGAAGASPASGAPEEDGTPHGMKAAGTGGRGGHSFSRGFVSASILFCTGSMAIVGSMQSGLQGNHEILFAKSVLDGSMSLVFGASMGIGTAFAAIPVLLYQGGIVLASVAVKDLLSPAVIREMSAVGSLLIAAIGFNFLGVKEIRVANLIPAVFIPWIYLAAEQFLGR
ncbi:MAG: DUF554 domain-containing protein [Treponema sp.]|jgi:uncharacterized membrane protein YqgA involved in biofilm formation|nr:DUF554 domain-containing protein [Treponema sp.]